MIESVINAISNGLYHSFDENISIYTESMNEIVKKPCVFLLLKDFKETKILSNRYKQTATFNITYYPKKQSMKNDEMIQKFSCIKDNLELIFEGENYYKSNNITFNINDGVLTVIAIYDYFVLKEKEPYELMGDLSIKNKGKKYE